MAHRFTILSFEIVVLKKLSHIRSHDLRSSLPFPLDDLINQVIGDDKPQSRGHDADADETINGKPRGQAGVGKESQWRFAKLYEPVENPHSAMTLAPTHLGGQCTWTQRGLLRVARVEYLHLTNRGKIKRAAWRDRSFAGTSQLRSSQHGNFESSVSPRSSFSDHSDSATVAGWSVNSNLQSSVHQQEKGRCQPSLSLVTRDLDSVFAAHAQDCKA
jgi:hypothetical protein